MGFRKERKEEGKTDRNNEVESGGGKGRDQELKMGRELGGGGVSNLGKISKREMMRIRDTGKRAWLCAEYS